MRRSLGLGLLLLAFLLLACESVRIGPAGKSARYLRGDGVSGTIPEVKAIWRGEGNACTGFLLTNSTFVTSARCLFIAVDPSEAIGEHRLSSTPSDLTVHDERLGTIRRASEIFAHPLFAEVVDQELGTIIPVADVALVRVAEPFENELVREIADNVPGIGTVQLAYGSGIGDGVRDIGIMNSIEMEVVGRTECHRQLIEEGYNAWAIRDLTHICCQAHPQAGMCPSDRGGPLLDADSRVTGMASFTREYIEGCYKHKAQVFTNLITLKPWIEEMAYNSTSEELKSYGESCSIGTECKSGVCLDDLCDFSMCISPESRPDGCRCKASTECFSGVCLDSTCSACTADQGLDSLTVQTILQASANVRLAYNIDESRIGWYSESLRVAGESEMSIPICRPGRYVLVAAGSEGFGDLMPAEEVLYFSLVSGDYEQTVLSPVLGNQLLFAENFYAATDERPTPIPTRVPPATPSPTPTEAPTVTEAPTPTATPSPVPPTASPSPTPVPMPRRCFAGWTTVELIDGSTRSMSELRRGECIRVSEEESGCIFFFSHQDSEVTMEAVRIATDRGVITLSTSHYVLLFPSRSLIDAGSVTPGTQLVHHIHGGTVVRSVERMIVEGAYAPHTDSKASTLVVNGFVVSEFSTSLHPGLAQWLLYLARVFRVTHIPHKILDLTADVLNLPRGPSLRIYS